MTDTPTPNDVPLPGMPHNPTHTDHGIPRRADTLLRMLIDDFQKVWDAVWSDPPKVELKEVARLNGRIVELYGQIYLLAALRHFAPHDAHRAAAALADAWDAGDSLGEWVYQWRTELDAGQPFTLFFAGEDDDQ